NHFLEYYPCLSNNILLLPSLLGETALSVEKTLQDMRDQVESNVETEIHQVDQGKLVHSIDPVCVLS
ncbi:hypothetical protein MKX01_036794, partial [Papaver californicum]